MRYIEKTIHQKPKVERWITDTTTGLDWAVYNQKKLNWDEAKEYAKSLEDGWRLPTDKEIESIIDRSKYEPATDIPEIVSTFYWSSSEYLPNPSNAWRVYMYYGSLDNYYKTFSYQVVCVRNSKSL